jgi:hypothetical protein
MKIVFLVILILAGCYFLGLEVMRTGAGRRAGLDDVELLRRLRRRIKTFVLLLALYVMAAWYEEIARWGYFTPKATLLYFGAAFAILIWLLILAAREVRDAAHMALETSRRIRTETIEELEKEIDRARKQPPRPPAKADPPPPPP